MSLFDPAILNTPGLTWMGRPLPTQQSDLLYRQTWTGDSSNIPAPYQAQEIAPIRRPTEDEERASEINRIMELFRQYTVQRVAEPMIPMAPLQVDPVVAPQEEGINTEDSFKPQRKLDLD